jgi:hypothetical protein
MIRALKPCPDDTAFLIRHSHYAFLASLYQDGVRHSSEALCARGSRQDDSVYALHLVAKFSTPQMQW